MLARSRKCQIWHVRQSWATLKCGRCHRSVIRLSDFTIGNAGEHGMDEKHFELWARSVGGKPEQFAAGQTIFSQGESGNRMYIVRSGSVDILVNGLLVETVEPNGIFGEMAVVDGGARSATARAQTVCELIGPNRSADVRDDGGRSSVLRAERDARYGEPAPKEGKLNGTGGSAAVRLTSSQP